MMMKIGFLLLAMGSSNAKLGQTKANDELPNGKPFQDLYEQIDILAMNMTELAAMVHDNVGDLQDQLDTLAAQVEANGDNTTLLHEQQAVQDKLIAKLDGSLRLLTHRVSLNEADVVALHLMEATLKTAVATIGSRVKGLEKEIVSLGYHADVNTEGVRANARQIVHVDFLLQQELTMLQQAIDVAEELADANTMSISGLESDLAAVRTELATKQKRVHGICTSGYSIREIHEDGTISCEYDNKTASLVGYTSTIGSYLSGYSYQGDFLYSHQAVAYCLSAGHTVSGGGFYKSSPSLTIAGSRPYHKSNAWHVWTHFSNSRSGYVNAYVRCISAS